MKRKYSGVCCINQYPQTKPKLVGLNFKRSKIIEDYVHIRAKGVSHTTSIHNHWTISYHYKSSLRVCSIESMIVIRSFKMAHLGKNKSTFSLPFSIFIYIFISKNGIALWYEKLLIYSTIDYSTTRFLTPCQITNSVVHCTPKASYMFWVSYNWIEFDLY